jgi:hypothetical protein
MKAYFVDDKVYEISEVLIDDAFLFDGQFQYFKTETEARKELLGIIEADVDHLQNIHAEESSKLGS